MLLNTETHAHTRTKTCKIRFVCIHSSRACEMLVTRTYICKECVLQACVCMHTCIRRFVRGACGHTSNSTISTAHVLDAAYACSDSCIHKLSVARTSAMLLIYAYALHRSTTQSFSKEIPLSNTHGAYVNVYEYANI